MNAREKRLLSGFLAILLLGGAFVGFSVYLERRDVLLAERQRLEDEWIEIETLFEERELWELRAEWLDRHQPAFTSTEEIAQSIFRAAEADGVPGVATDRLNLLPVEQSTDFVQAGVSLTAVGELPQVFRWLYELTRPESFHVVSNLKLAPDNESPEQIIAQFNLLRWYSNP